MNNPHTFIFFGIVGSGKGTQVELLEKYINENSLATKLVLASPGIGYRKLISEGYYTGKIVQTILDKGYLQPDFLTNGLVVSNLAFEMTEDSWIIADGYPRTIVQSKALEEMLAYYGRTSVHVIYIELSKEEAIKRMKMRARSDDTEEGIARRFDEYLNNVLPTMEYFKGKKEYDFHTINGEQAMEVVHADLIKSLGI